MAPTVPGPPIGTVRDALAAAGVRFTEILRRVSDPSPPAIGEWSIGETAAHVASSPLFFLAVARGEHEPEALGDVAANNAAVLAADPERDPRVLADRYAAGELALLAYVDGLGGDPEIEVFRGVRGPMSMLLAVELGEILVHGYDIARASGLTWSIGRAEAAAAVGGMLPLLPYMVDGPAAAGRRVRYELRIRGGESAVLDFDDGVLRIAPSAGQPVDCRVSADPATYLLLSFARIGILRPILRGRLRAWGRRPWLGALLPSLFQKV